MWAGADVIEPDHSAGADQPVARRFGRRGGARVRHAHPRVRRRTASNCPRPSRRSAGRTRTPCWSAPISGRARSPSPDTRAWSSGGAAARPLADAETVFSGAPSDVIVAGSVDRTEGFERTVLSRALDFFNEEVYELRGGELIRIDTPTDASISVHRNWLLIELRTDWAYACDRRRTYPSRLAAGRRLRRVPLGHSGIDVVFTPDEHTSLHHYAWTRDRLVVVTLVDVASHVEVSRRAPGQAEPVAGLPREHQHRRWSPPTASAMRSSWTLRVSTHRHACCTEQSAVSSRARSNAPRRSSTPPTSR